MTTAHDEALVQRTYAREVDTDIPGWSLRCLQTTGGALAGGSQEVHVPGLQLLHERYANVVTSHSGRGPSQTVMFSIPTGMQADGRFNARQWPRGSLCALGTDRDFEAITPPTQLLCVVLDAHRVVDYIRTTEQEDVSGRLTGTDFVFHDPMAVTRLAHRLSVLVREGFSRGTQAFPPSLREALAQDVIEWLAPLLVEHLLGPHVHERHARVHIENVRRARDYALSRIEEPLRVEDLCAALPLSRRALQASFQAVLGLSPQIFLRTLRLNGARRSLQDGLSVKETVATWGFWHWSRFSQDYRALFGERPSETQSRSESFADPGYR